jgi:hypothetical protein
MNILPCEDCAEIVASFCLLFLTGQDSRRVNHAQAVQHIAVHLRALKSVEEGVAELKQFLMFISQIIAEICHFQMSFFYIQYYNVQVLENSITLKTAYEKKLHARKVEARSLI